MRESEREKDKERQKNKKRDNSRGREISNGKEKERDEKKYGMLISLNSNFCAYIKVFDPCAGNKNDLENVCIGAPML